MKDEVIGIVVACVFSALGVVLLCSYGFASWGIYNLKAGQRWANWFGEERAISILRFVAGPFFILVGGIVIWAAMSGRMPS